MAAHCYLTTLPTEMLLHEIAVWLDPASSVMFGLTCLHVRQVLGPAKPVSLKRVLAEGNLTLAKRAFVRTLRTLLPCTTFESKFMIEYYLSYLCLNPGHATGESLEELFSLVQIAPPAAARVSKLLSQTFNDLTQIRIADMAFRCSVFADLVMMQRDTLVANWIETMDPSFEDTLISSGIEPFRLGWIVARAFWLRDDWFDCFCERRILPGFLNAMLYSHKSVNLFYNIGEKHPAKLVPRLMKMLQMDLRFKLAITGQMGVTLQPPTKLVPLLLFSFFMRCADMDWRVDTLCRKLREIEAREDQSYLLDASTYIMCVDLAAVLATHLQRRQTQPFLDTWTQCQPRVFTWSSDPENAYDRWSLTSICDAVDAIFPPKDTTLNA